MKTLIALIPVIGLVLFFAMPRAQAADGKQVFQDSKCNGCHSVDKQKIECTKKGDKGKGPDLSATGTKHDAAWFKKWLLKEVEQEGKKHKKKFDGAEADLDALVTWLVSLKG